MVPLQAAAEGISIKLWWDGDGRTVRGSGGEGCHTELLLDHLEDLLLVEFLGQSLNSGQGLTTIAF